MLDIVRYFLALLIVATFPGALVIWLLLHSFVDTWRRLGPGMSYTLLASVGAGIAGVIYTVREPIMAVEFGISLWLSIGAIVSYGIAVFIEVKCRKYLSLSTLVGIPELAPKPENQRLLKEGIYGRVRHPRYLGLLLGVLAVALFTNYLAAYLLVALSTLGILWITSLEEHELIVRFGSEYLEYRKRVPRLVPRHGAVEA
jgi:protein-S-isoprenylcysteine O-methyltransferase Ste14